MSNTPSIHYMNLNPNPFKAIQSGKKTVEMRLYDEKRRLLKAGDTIVFTNTYNQERLSVKIKSLAKYRDFHDLYTGYDKISIGYSEEEEASPEDMLLYYSQEQVAAYGVLAIEIEII